MTLTGKPRAAYTLFELLLVGAIIVVLAAIAYPTLNGLIGNKGLTGKRGRDAALDELKNKLAQARGRAMEEGRPYRVAVVLGKGNLRLAPDTDDYWGGGGSGSSDGHSSMVVACALPPGSCFRNPDSADGAPRQGEITSQDPDSVSPGEYKTLVVFLPDGTHREDGKISLATVGARRITVKLQAQTSALTTQEG
jgi:Tfp pilus assembly protein FimT